jgi:phenylalanyl-tRNA synthetase alpha subunit
MNDILTSYQKELNEQLVIDEFTLKDVQLQLPGRRHLWVGRLMRHKHELNQLKKEKTEKLIELTKVIQEQSNVRLSTPAAEKVATNTSNIKELNNKIQEQYVLIEYLEKVEKIMSSIGFDVRNIIEIQKLETQ